MTGFNSYSAYTAQPQVAPNDNAQIQTRDTTSHVSTVDGVVTEQAKTVERGSSAQLNPFYGTDTWQATAINLRGGVLTELTPETSVTIGGLQAPISAFLEQGILTKDADGAYVLAGATAAPQEDTSGLLPLSDQAMYEVNQALDVVDQGSVDNLAAAGVSVALGRMDHASLVTKFQQASGLDIGEAQARVTTITAAYQAQADNALMTRSGLAREDLGHFYAWAKVNKGGALQEAALRQFHSHDVSGYKALATQWSAATAPSIDALKASGVPVRQNGGKDEAFIAGQWMSPGAAARAGLY